MAERWRGGWGCGRDGLGRQAKAMGFACRRQRAAEGLRESVEKENGAGGRVPPEARKGNSSGKDGGDLIEPRQKQRGQWTKELLKE